MIVGATKKAPTSTKIRLAVEWGKATPRTGCINMPSEKSLLRGNYGGNPLHLTTRKGNEMVPISLQPTQAAGCPRGATGCRSFERAATVGTTSPVCGTLV